MKQLIFIRGGEAFDSQDQYYAFLQSFEYNPFDTWTSRRQRLMRELEWKVQCISPDMPCKQNATYRARKIRFEKLFPYLTDDVILVGYSLGGRFLSKYLAENTFPIRVSQLHLVATPLDAEGVEGEGAADFDFDKQNLVNIAGQVADIHIYYSQDDDIVPAHHLETFKTYLPWVKQTLFSDRWHFFVSEFPELLANIIPAV